MDNNRNYRSVNGFTIITFMVIVFGAALDGESDAGASAGDDVHRICHTG